MSDLAGYLNISHSNSYYFTNACNNDILIYPETSNQAIHLGITSNSASLLALSSSNVVIYGAASLCNALNVSGAATLSNGLTVYNRGTTMLSNAVNIYGATTVSNALTTTGNVTVGTALADAFIQSPGQLMFAANTSRNTSFVNMNFYTGSNTGGSGGYFWYTNSTGLGNGTQQMSLSTNGTLSVACNITVPTANINGLTTIFGPNNLGNQAVGTSNTFLSLVGYTVQGSAGNSSYLNIYDYKHTFSANNNSSNSWFGVGTKIQKKVDNVNQGYIEFNPSNGAFGMAFGNGGSEYMRITGGNVGIGTTAPAAKLDVNGGINCTTWQSACAGAGFAGPFLYTGGTNGNAVWFGLSNPNLSTNPWYSTTIQFLVNGQTVASFGSNNTYFPNNVGIGTANPGAKLDVAGIINASSNIKIGTASGTTNANNYPGVFIGAESSQNAVIVGDILAKTGFTMGIDQSDSKFKIQTGAGLATGLFTSPAITISNNGYVGIGTPNPAYKLDIPSGTYSTRITTYTTGGIILGDISTSIDVDAIVQIGGTASLHTALAMYQNSTNSQTHIVFVNPNGRVGSIVTSGSTTIFNTSSDYRLKTNIEPMTNIWNQFMQLNPVTFNFKSDLDTQIQGFIAHEVQDIVPLAVTGEKDAVDKDGKEIYQGIDASKLIPLLVAALKDLKKTTDDQASQIATLTAQFNCTI
jgi:hypothetical protein